MKHIHSTYEGMQYLWVTFNEISHEYCECTSHVLHTIMSTAHTLYNPKSNQYWQDVAS